MLIEHTLEDITVVVEEFTEDITVIVSVASGGGGGGTGPQGPKGDKGDKGDPFIYEDFTPQQLEDLKGTKGDTGDQGPQGLQGIQGEIGPQGEQGLKGDKGEQGIQGIQGIQGPIGETGPKGDKGDKGDTGAPGTPAITTDVISLFLSASGKDLTTGDTDTIEAPYAFTLNSAFIAVTDAPTGGNIVVDYKKNGVAITSTKATINSGGVNSLTGVSPVFTTVTFAKGDRITHNIFQVGSLTTGKSLKSYLTVTKI